MAVYKVSQKAVLKDIRSGMDETAIRQKYHLSVKALRRLYQKLTEDGLLSHDFKPIPRTINLIEILNDIHGGMSDADLMEKYVLSEDMLRQVSKKLLDARGIRSAADEPDTIVEEPSDFVATREFFRHEVDLELPVYEASRPEVHGMLRDISEEGVSIAGLEAQAGDVMTLVVLSDELGEFSSFEFEGYCRWSFVDPEDGTYLSGFAINEISESDLLQLRKLVRLINVGG